MSNAQNTFKSFADMARAMHAEDVKRAENLRKSAALRRNAKTGTGSGGGAMTTTYYVSEYEADLCYGGPEEGGWYFDWLTHVTVRKSFTCQDEAYAYCRALNTAQAEQDRAEGKRDRSSVIGTPDTVFHVETAIGEDETTERPYYC